MIFTIRIGWPLDPSNVVRSRRPMQTWIVLVRRILQNTRPDFSKPTSYWWCADAMEHALTAASLLLAEGVPVKVVQEILGHSLLSTTADTYGHLFPEAFDEAADAMERALAGSTAVRDRLV